MRKISSIVIAKNEENNISRCIRSQIDCIDDIIVVVDDKTTDSTIDKIKEFPLVRFEVIKWRGYSATKKYAVELTKYDWVFWIDADEEITNELLSEIIEFKNSEIVESSAFQVARRAYFLDKWIKHSGWYPGYVTRLFDKTKCRFNDNSVHENLIVDGKISKLKNDLNHFTDPNIHHYFEKFNNYTTLAAIELNKKNKKVGLNDILLRPLFLFSKMYIFRLGFLDGIHGFMLAIFSATYVGVKYAKTWELNKKEK